MDTQDTASKANTVLIVEDDREIGAIIATNIEDLGLETEYAADGETGLNLALNGKYALVILDLMLPDLDGIAVCTRIRARDAKTPILMLTAKAEERDRVLGLELGADDYMTKPFSVRELAARIRALLRRSQIGPAAQGPEMSGHSPGDRQSAVGAGFGTASPESLCIGGLRVDFTKRRVSLKENVIDLTVKEFDLLGLFIKHPGRAYSRTDLLNLVWGYNFEGYEHTVNTHINRLRGKIEEDPAHPKLLKTVWGLGYRFAEESEFPPCS